MSAERIYRLLLRAYPADFRAQYGREMVLLFRDQCQENDVRTLGFWAAVICDVARSAPALHAEAWRARVSENTRTVEVIMKLPAVLRRHVGPFGIAFALLTGAMLIPQITKQLPDLRSAGVPTSVIVEIIGLSIPFIVAVTLPMAVLVAVLRVFTRLRGDRALMAMEAGGVRVLPFITPVLGAATCVAVLALLWNSQILPRSNHRLRTMLIDIQRNTPSLAGKESDAFRGDREMTIGELRRAARSARETADSAGARKDARIERPARYRAAAYEVELQKKYALAAACLFFALFAAPVGLRFPHRGNGFVASVTVVVFVMYYVGLIAGEELADRLVVSPFFAMWTPNLILGGVGLLAVWPMRRQVYTVPDEDRASNPEST